MMVTLTQDCGYPVNPVMYHTSIRLGEQYSCPPAEMKAIASL